MFLRRLGKRGTAIVEYAIILAFAAAVGSSFTSDNGMTGSIKSIIGNVNQMLGVAAGKEETGKFLIEESNQQYKAVMEEFINRIYNELSIDPNHPPKEVWVSKDGVIEGYIPWGDNGEGGGYIKFESPIPVSNFAEGYDYTIRHGTHICFDDKGNVVNLGNSTQWQEISRVYLTNIKDPSLNKQEPNGTRYEACLTFNSNNGTFGSEEDYWQK